MCCWGHKVSFISFLVQFTLYLHVFSFLSDTTLAFLFMTLWHFQLAVFGWAKFWVSLTNQLLTLIKVKLEPLIKLCCKVKKDGCNCIHCLIYHVGVYFSHYPDSFPCLYWESLLLSRNTMASSNIGKIQSEKFERGSEKKVQELVLQVHVSEWKYSNSLHAYKQQAEYWVLTCSPLTVGP